MDNKDLDYDLIRSMGYGEHLIVDDNGEVLATSCTHYFDDSGMCIFCGEIKFNSYLYLKYFGGE